MKAFQDSIKNGDKFDYRKLDFKPDLILLFVSPGFDNIDAFVKATSTAYPETVISGCSTCGEINDVKVEDNTVVFNAIQFEKTEVKLASRNVSDFEDCTVLGKELVSDLVDKDLQH